MKDLSDLPRGNGRTGLLPDAEPRFIGVLVDKWAAEADDNKPTALGTPFRHSDAGKCARAISYTAAKIPASNPMDLTGVWNTTLGSRIHEWWQEALAERWPDAEIEPKVRTVGADGSGHLDAVIREDLFNEEMNEVRPWVTCYELKTVGGYGFKSSIGVARKGTPAEGPNPSHLYQAALNAAAVDADETVIGYLSKEAVGVGIGRSNNMTPLDRIAAEWTFTRDQYMPFAEKEAKRVAGILALVDEGTLSRRVVPDEMPPGAEIVDPARSAWTVEVEGVTAQTGSLWGGQYCDYCKYLDLCSQTQPGRIPISSVKVDL
jgi:hypothetical protein